MAKTKKHTEKAELKNESKPGQRLPDGEYFILPDVTDIPGQEHMLSAGIPEEMADTTVSSDDEEGIRDGKDILDEDDNEQLNMVVDEEEEEDEDDRERKGKRS